ncbi:UNVERIFIED_CONTAM: hypothetical protein Sradi_4018500 [Sesamum radiatum]|uniref:Uncharacterized protein n=1 Tax=Sesamum radiatum TaxID=300843 RepID=A0AAW2PMV6_SESRA
MHQTNRRPGRHLLPLLLWALQVVPSTSLTSLSGTTTTAKPRSTDPTADIPRITATPDAPPVELSPTLLATF